MMPHDSNVISCDSHSLTKGTDVAFMAQLLVKTDEIHDNDELLVAKSSVQSESHCGVNTNSSQNELREECKEKGSSNWLLAESLSNRTDVKNSIESHTKLPSENSGNDTDVKSNSNCLIQTNEQKNDMTPSSLKMIAMEYSCSDSEVTESDSEHPQSLTRESALVEKEDTITEQSRTVYRSHQKKILSSDKSDSEEDSSSSSSDSESSSESSSLSSLTSNANESDNDNNTQCNNRNEKTTRRSTKELKSELDDLPPIEDLTISVPEVLCDPVGEVSWTVDQLVVVRPKPGKPTLNLDTVLFVDKGQRALGKIFDVFGQVSEPYYCVRFNSSEHIQEKDIKIGMTVYYCPNTPYTSLVFLHELTKMKGTDDVDGDDEAPDFSDDEEEQKYYAALKEKERKVKSNGNTIIPHKRRRGSSPTRWKSNHPWNRNANFHKNEKEKYNRGNDGAWLRNPVQNSYRPRNPWPPMSAGLLYQNNPWYSPMQTESPNDCYTNPYSYPAHPTQWNPYDTNVRSRYNNPYPNPQAYPGGTYANAPTPSGRQTPFTVGPPWFRMPLPQTSLPPPPPPPPPPLSSPATSSSTQPSPST